MSSCFQLNRPCALLLLSVVILLGSACSSLHTVSNSAGSTTGLEPHSSNNIVFLNNSASSKSDILWTTEKPPSLEEVKRAVKAGEADEKLSMMGDWWLYGPGIGYTMLNLGTVVLFPPYALYLLGNAALSISGAEPIRIVDIIPEGESRAAIEGALDEVCSVPGRLNAAVAGKPFVDHLSVENN